MNIRDNVDTCVCLFIFHERMSGISKLLSFITRVCDCDLRAAITFKSIIGEFRRMRTCARAAGILLEINQFFIPLRRGVILLAKLVVCLFELRFVN